MSVRLGHSRAMAQAANRWHSEVHFGLAEAGPLYAGAAIASTSAIVEDVFILDP
jgi:hypothetical protein